jgi:hypothetical protein
VPNVKEASKSFWTHQMLLLGDEARVETHFGPFGDSVTVGAKLVHALCQSYQRLRNSFGRTRWYS